MIPATVIRQSGRARVVRGVVRNGRVRNRSSARNADLWPPCKLRRLHTRCRASALAVRLDVSNGRRCRCRPNGLPVSSFSSTPQYDQAMLATAAIRSSRDRTVHFQNDRRGLDLGYSGPLPSLRSRNRQNTNSSSVEDVSHETVQNVNLAQLVIWKVN